MMAVSPPATDRLPDCGDGEQLMLEAAARLDGLPRASAPPGLSGVIRCAPEDFQVREILGFDLSGSGEHLYLLVRKTGQNTRWVAKRLADAAGLRYRDVGYAGLKDRHAVTEQWFSLHLPGRELPPSCETGIDGVEILRCTRHGAKLRIGQLAGNRFRVIVRDLRGPRGETGPRVARIAECGVPNYFGDQRFGRGRRNLSLLQAEPARGRLRREARAFGLSALRAALFNGYLAGRVTDGSWQKTLPGEVVYRGAEGRFRVGAASPAADDEPSGLLWGCGENRATGQALDCEQEFLAQFPRTTATLEAYRARLTRRRLVCPVHEPELDSSGDALVLGFALDRGCFATAVLRELVATECGNEAANRSHFPS